MKDIDSIVCSYKDDGKSTVKTGCLLGDWTDELDKNIWTIDWVSTGPKTKDRFHQRQLKLTVG
jgi:hypothetical protein